MSNDGVSPEDQAAISAVARSVMQQLAAGRSAEEVARELQMNGWQKSTADALVEHVLQDWQRIEAAPQANAVLYLQMKYPEMKPAGSAPALHTVNGIGTMFYGSRDLDRPTDTYVKTQCFCLLFVPIFALKSYRVASRGSGWSLIGRVPLSRFAKTWNILVLCAILGAVGTGILSSFLLSPSHVASRTLARADEAAAAGKLLEASRLYREVAHTHTEYAAAARQRCTSLVARPEMDSLPLNDVIQVFDQVLQAGLSGDNAPVLARGLALVKSHAQAESAGSIELLTRVARLSSSDACKEFGELVSGPLAARPPAETVALFREAAVMPQDEGQKTGMVALGVVQCRRLAASDLPSACELLAILAALGDRPAVDKCLTEVLGAPLEKAPCSEVAKAVRIAKDFAGPMGEKEIFQAGIAWLEHHADAPCHGVFDLLDQLAELHGADRSRIAAARRPLLEKLVAADPQDVDLSVQLALALEAESPPQGGKKQGEGHPGGRISRLLSPLREKLGTGEGARLLGQALAAEGKFDESYALLGPYLETRLDAFHEAEQASQNAAKQAWTRAQLQLQSGKAPGFDYARVRRAAENERKALVADYMSRQVKDDAAAEAARETLAKQGMIVPAALDLGMVTLQRAQAMKDPAARRTELERAEKTFLAIRGTAGESDQYMLRLGQVYYWLGKQEEGREEFDKLLVKHDRNAEFLFALAHVLRELGMHSEARKLMEEAYDKAPLEKLRHDIAHLRASTATGLDDEIHWLERCDASEAGVKALLAESRGSRAQMQGKDDEAAAHYRAAVAIYERAPQDIGVLNNGALAYMAIFELTGDHQALERGTQWLEKAVSLSPTDSVILINAIHQILRAANQDLAGNKLNLRELQMSENINALYYLAKDQKSLDEIRAQARENAGIRKCLSYIERANVLAPRNLSSRTLAAMTYSFLHDRDGLQRLARQVAASKPDTEEYTAKVIKSYHYQDDESGQEKKQSKTTRADALVSRLSARGEKGPQYVAAVDDLVNQELSLPEDAVCDADLLVRLAEDAHRSAPSVASYRPLIKALSYRAGRKLAADYPEYAKATRGTGRAVSASYTVVLAMARSDALGKAARENKDLQRAIALAAARAEAFPETRSCWEWAILGSAVPGQADLRAKCLLPDEFNRIQRQVEQSLWPINPHEAFETYWRRLAAGEANAREPLDQLLKLGVPLPVGLIQGVAGAK